MAKARPYNTKTDDLTFATGNIKDIYEFIDVLGEGQFGVVYLARLRCNNDKLFAVKALKKTPQNESFFQKEVSILRDLDHPFIIRLLEVFISSEYLFMVMDYCRGGSLHKYLDKHPKEFKLVFY